MIFQQHIAIQTPRLLSWLKRHSSALALLTGIAAMPHVVTAEEATFLVQLKEYTGEGAYLSLYLVDPSDRYVRTLWVSGDDAE